MRALDSILGKASHLAVLRVLHHAESPLTGREVQRRSALCNRATMLALRALAEKRIVLVQEENSRHLFQVNPRHFLWTKAIRPALEAEEDFWEDLRKSVRRAVAPRPEAAMVTGTLARDETTDGGILELHLLFATGRQRLQAFRSLARLKDTIDSRYALEVHATFMDMRNMDDAEFQSLWRRIAREGILLFGKLP